MSKILYREGLKAWELTRQDYEWLMEGNVFYTVKSSAYAKCGNCAKWLIGLAFHERLLYAYEFRVSENAGGCDNSCGGRRVV